MSTGKSTAVEKIDVSQTGDAQIAEMLNRGRDMKAARKGRLIFALDATGSRQDMWNQSVNIQNEMFTIADEIGGMLMMLIYHQASNICKASGWVSNSSKMTSLMNSVRCSSGHTQIERTLKKCVVEAKEHEGEICAVVYVGDCIEEDFDDVCKQADILGRLGVPVFVFQEGNNYDASNVFPEIARVSAPEGSNGVYFKFDPNAIEELRGLLKAVAAYSAGGFDALEHMKESGDKAAVLLLEKLS